MIRKILPTMTFLTFFLMVVFLSIYVYWCYIEPVPLVIKDPMNIQVDKKVYEPGDTIHYTFEYCKTKDTTAIVGRKLVDGIEINFPAKQIRLELGCHIIVRSDLSVPTIISPGVYHLEGQSLHHTNPFREDVVKWRSVEFYIK